MRFLPVVERELRMAARRRSTYGLRLLVALAAFTLTRRIEMFTNLGSQGFGMASGVIVGQSLGLHAVVIMLAVLVGGTVFGFIGMLLAVPVTAALSVFWIDLRDLYLRSGFYRGPPAQG